jgi:HSP90 family molecular chaperone
MKLQQNTNKVIRSDSFEESKFTIEASAKAFSILSDGLYADKIKAVIRELSTNAYDAHIEVGKGDEPFLVHLPNRFEPNFYIRDYGTGLSHEDCMNLYTTYFGSTKTDSNDAIGCLGLGSKSPFAYTDSFTVTSYFNGEKRVYNSFKNEHDEPVFVLLSEEASDEVNGIEVMLSVDEYDVE